MTNKKDKARDNWYTSTLLNVFGVTFTFCPSARSSKLLGKSRARDGLVKLPGLGNNRAGRTSWDSHSRQVVVALSEELYAAEHRIQLHDTIAHEAHHVSDAVMDLTGEEANTAELAAWITGSVTAEIWRILTDQKITD